MGVAGKVCENSVEINGTGIALESLNVEAKNVPDLVPVCAALACVAKDSRKSLAFIGLD